MSLLMLNAKPPFFPFFRTSISNFTQIACWCFSAAHRGSWRVLSGTKCFLTDGGRGDGVSPTRRLLYALPIQLDEGIAYYHFEEFKFEEAIKTVIASL